MSQNSEILQGLGQTGQVASFAELEKLVFDFEGVLNRFGVTIQSGSEVEGACCSVLEVLGKNQTAIRNSNEDIREVFTEVLGIWTFLKKIVRLQNHGCFSQFVPHLSLLNKGTVVQNKRSAHVRRRPTRFSSFSLRWSCSTSATKSSSITLT